MKNTSTVRELLLANKTEWGATLERCYDLMDEHKSPREFTCQLLWHLLDPANKMKLQTDLIPRSLLERLPLVLVPNVIQACAFGFEKGDLILMEELIKIVDTISMCPVDAITGRQKEYDVVILIALIQLCRDNEMPDRYRENFGVFIARALKTALFRSSPVDANFKSALSREMKEYTEYNQSSPAKERLDVAIIQSIYNLIGNSGNFWSPGRYENLECLFVWEFRAKFENEMLPEDSFRALYMHLHAHGRLKV